MNTTYAIHTHDEIWATDSNGQPLISQHIVLELQPESGAATYWYMPECVGSFKAECTACGKEPGQMERAGVLTSDEEFDALIRELMGSRYGYNDRLRTNVYRATSAARGELSARA